MAEFNWVQGPPYGVCFGCGTSSSDRGFVQTFADVDVRQDGEIVGVADVFFCGSCIHAQGRLVGMATPQETEDFARREFELVNDNEKLKDEIQAWQERFLQLSGFAAEDLEQLQKLKESNDSNADPQPES